MAVSTGRLTGRATASNGRLMAARSTASPDAMPLFAQGTHRLGGEVPENARCPAPDEVKDIDLKSQ